MITEQQKLLTEVDQTFRTFLYLPQDHHYTLATLWTAGTHLRTMDGAFLPFTYSRFYWGSNSPGCGKTLGMDVMLAMCYRGKALLHPTVPSVITTINMLRGTVGIDEFDQQVGRGNASGQLFAIINGGYKRGAVVTKQRQDDVVEENVHGPMVLTGKNANRVLTSDNFSTIRSRSLMTIMERMPAEVADDYDEYDPEIHEARLHHVSSRMTRWGLTEARAVLSRTPDMPAGIRNRDRELWKVLFQIAAHVGGEWPSRVESAARAFVLGEHDGTLNESPADELLRAVRAVFVGDRMSSADLVMALKLFAGDSWWHREWIRSDRAAAMSLSAMLKVNGIVPQNVRYGDQVLKSYTKADVFGSDRSDVATVATSDTEDWTYGAVREPVELD